jgi:Cu/Ag efflux protein CusF
MGRPYAVPQRAASAQRDPQHGARIERIADEERGRTHKRQEAVPVPDRAEDTDSGLVAAEEHELVSWPSMTMWFAVKDMPHDIKAGDKVHFEMMQGDKKQWMIERISK